MVHFLLLFISILLGVVENREPKKGFLFTW